MSCNTKITVDIKGVPPHAFYPHTLTSLLSSDCDAQSYRFNHENGVCTIHGVAPSAQAIPKHGCLGLLHRGHDETTINTYPLQFEADIDDTLGEDKDATDEAFKE
uniref:Uncharacterized protein n=1 Tax=Arundo donax TaxID=35708 RepID=A0A0A9G5X2_ARUDO